MKSISQKFTFHVELLAQTTSRAEEANIEMTINAVLTLPRANIHVFPLCVKINFMCLWALKK